MDVNKCYYCGKILRVGYHNGHILKGCQVELDLISRENPHFCNKKCRHEWIFTMIEKGRLEG